VLDDEHPAQAVADDRVELAAQLPGPRGRPGGRVDERRPELGLDRQHLKGLVAPARVVAGEEHLGLDQLERLGRLLAYLGNGGGELVGAGGERVPPGLEADVDERTEPRVLVVDGGPEALDVTVAIEAQARARGFEPRDGENVAHSPRPPR
jgi:hypothetical protein